MSYFDILPLEIIEHIMSFMGLVQKEHFTKNYEKYYHIFKEEKRKFLIENYHIDYKPLIKAGIEKITYNNSLCINIILRKKKFIIDSFPEIFRDTLIDINTPFIKYYPPYMKGDNIKCLYKDLKYNKFFGKNYNRKFIILKAKDTIIYLLEAERDMEWYYNIKENVGLLISHRYINFKMLDAILDMI